MIVWDQAQTRLAAAGYAPGGIDGKPGRMTFTALFACAARRPIDATIRALGTAAALPGTGLPSYSITSSAERLAEFLAQTAVESAGYTRFEENLRYSAKRLMAVWPKRFPTLESALPYAWDPSDPDREDVALANLVYGGRMGNESNGLADDDGWDHRGRGILQLTGIDNYRTFGERIGVDLIAEPDRAADPAVSLHIACEFWKEGRINAYVDRGDFYGARGIVNAGTPRPKQKPHGLDDVADRRGRMLKILS